MNTTQENKQSMYLTVKAVCDENAATWSGLTAFANTYTAFLAKLNLIQQLASAQAADRTGSARDKDAIQRTLADAVMGVSGALTAYATVQEDLTLQSEVSCLPGYTLDFP